MGEGEEYQLPTIKKANFDFSRIAVVKGNRGSARGELLDRFLEKLNPSRVVSGFKPLTHARLSVMLAHIKDIEDLHAFYRQCETAKITFSAYFHWALKPKKN